MFEQFHEFEKQAKKYIEGDEMAIDPFLLEDFLFIFRRQNLGKLITDEEKAQLKENGITLSVYRQRLYQGWDDEKARTTPRTRRKKNPYVELALKNGIKRTTYWKRVESGWDKEKAATAPVQRKFAP